MERTYLQLNIINTLTILFMASFGALLLGLIAAGLQTYGPLANNGANTVPPG